MQYKISFSCLSHIGNVRRINQDNIICDGKFIGTDNNIKFPITGEKVPSDRALFGVFDGLGGEERGEVASLIAAENAAHLKISDNEINDLLGFCKDANEKICTFAKENGLSSMGTTAAMLVFSEDKVTLCNIGDSKIFLFRNGSLEQISIDHLSIAPFGVKPPLSQNLGIPIEEMEIEPYVAQGAYNDGNVYLICSDGLTDMVSEDEIREILGSDKNEAAEELLNKALSHGGRDNISIIICKVVRERKSIFKRK